MIFVHKDPDAVLDYRWDWTSWLAEDDTVASHEVVEDGGLTVDSSTNDASSVTVWLSGGTAGLDTSVTVRVTTTAGRTDDRTAVFLIHER